VVLYTSNENWKKEILPTQVKRHEWIFQFNLNQNKNEFSCKFVLLTDIGKAYWMHGENIKINNQTPNRIYNFNDEQIKFDYQDNFSLLDKYQKEQTLLFQKLVTDLQIMDDNRMTNYTNEIESLLTEKKQYEKNQQGLANATKILTEKNDQLAKELQQAKDEITKLNFTINKFKGDKLEALSFSELEDFTESTLQIWLKAQTH